MEKLTINEILEREKIKKLSTLANNVGLSVSLLSKIRYGIARVTTATQTKLQAVYPNYELVGDGNNYKKLYNNLLSEYEKAKLTIKKQDSKIFRLTNQLNKIKNDVVKMVDTAFEIEGKFE